MLIQLTSPYFCAGVVVKDGVVTEAAPIVKWMKCKELSEVQTYCKAKKWKVVVVNED